MRPRASILLFGMTALLGCYRASIDTGVAPSNQVVEKRWASGWIFGLVAPSTVATAAQCPTGVARVATRLSFLNQVVGVVTMGIYTPMAIRVTCAEGVVTPSAALESPDSTSTAIGPAAPVHAADQPVASEMQMTRSGP